VVWPAAPPAPAGPAPEAVARFERGIAALHRNAHAAAAAEFRSILADFPSEGSIGDRARVYLGLCERALASTPAGPKTTEERLTAATAALNNGDLTRAGELAAGVLESDPKQDLALYLLAAVAARQGQLDTAIDRLRKAVALSPEAGAQARHDQDFESLHDLDDFWTLTEPPPAESRGGARRSRRGRATG
jgi:tetratricopeptide (TPR) repeat protein